MLRLRKIATAFKKRKNNASATLFRFRVVVIAAQFDILSETFWSNLNAF